MPMDPSLALRHARAFVRETNRIPTKGDRQGSGNDGNGALHRATSSPQQFHAAPSTGRKAPMTSTGHHIDFSAPAVLRKWPSLKNERRTEGQGAYLVVDGTLNECIRSFMAKPVSIRHLYEVHTLPQPPLVEPVLSGEIVAELARLQDFL
jgi:hypothetical protein